VHDGNADHQEEKYNDSELEKERELIQGMEFET